MKKLLLLLAAVLPLFSCSMLQNINTERVMTGGSKVVQALGVTNDQMKSYVTSSVAQLDAAATVLPASNAYSKRLARITSGLTKVDDTPLNFKVYKQDEVNAFACADGSVRVYTGLMDIMSDNEILGVIGHEVGHVAMEHTMNAYKYALYTSAAFDVIASTGNLAAALTDSVLGQLGQSMIEARYSRKQETEADDFGYSFLKAAGVNPWYMASAFEQLQKAAGESGAAPSSVTEMFSSHPNTASRIERMSAKCTADGFTRPE
ncbi:MAG: M48 family metalloprotease [Bacteroidales bacterium]|nr:M48 family metalloprotease [Bacteroidales bacterium]